MPSTVVHVSFALLLAAALLGRHYDRRALAVVAAVAAFPDLDSFASLVVESTHRAVLHTLIVPGGLAAVMLWDTRLRERSWLRERWGARGVHVAWVSLTGYVVAAIGLDLFQSMGVNLFYPVVDQFVGFSGTAGVRTKGFFQTFIDVTPTEPSGGAGGGVDVGQRGSTQDVHVGSGVDPTKGPESRTVRRTFPVVFRGWHLLVVLSTAFVLVARTRIRELDAEGKR